MPPHRGRAIACLALALSAGTLCAQQRLEVLPQDTAPAPVIARPGASNRIVRLFDFEELATNPGEVPAHWFRAQDTPARPRPGFPAWNRAELRYTGEGAIAFEGAGAVQLPTSGGSTALILEDGVVPVFKSADYAVSAMVRTVKLTHARAALVARLLDARGQPLPGSEVRSPLLHSEHAWQPVRVEVHAGNHNAAYLQLELQLLQPEQQGRTPDPTTIWPQDFEGSAWFDNVTIAQLPRIELSTDTPLNVLTQPPRLTALVRDLTGEPLTARLEVFDSRGRSADTHEQKLGAGDAKLTWQPRLSQLGWYRAKLTVASESQPNVGESSLDFVWINTPATAHAPDALLRADHTRFGFELSTADPQHLASTPALTRTTGAGSVAISLLEGITTPQSAKAKAESLAPTINTILDQRTQVTFVLGELPAPLAGTAQVEPSNTWALLSGKTVVWLPYLAPFLEQHGQRVPRWQIGPTAAPHASPASPDDWRRTTAALGALIESPVLGTPAAWGAERPAGNNSTPPLLATLVPSSATPAAVRLTVQSAAPFLESGGELRLVLDTDTATPDALAPASHAVKCAVEFWAAISQPDGRTLPGASLSLNRPFADTAGNKRTQAPSPALAAWPNLVDRLAGRRVVGKLPAQPDAVCYILAPASTSASRTGALVAWSESAAPAYITGDLGRAPLTAIDVFGNRAPIAAPPDPSHPWTHKIALSDTPVFIEGIDVDLIRFTAAAAIDPPVLESSIEQHERELVLVNPWPTGIAGKVTFLEPGGFDTGRKDRTWRISPRAQTFSVPAGKTERIPFKVSVSPAEEVGPKDFVLSFELSGLPYGPIEVRRTVELTVKNLAVDLTATTPNGRDVVIEATFTNRATTPLTLELTCFAEGFPRSKAVITDLPATTPTTRRFTYPNAAPKLKGQRIMVSAFDPDTKARVNKSVVVP